VEKIVIGILLIALLAGCTAWGNPYGNDVFIIDSNVTNDFNGADINALHFWDANTLGCSAVATTPSGELVCTTITAVGDVNNTDINVNLLYDVNLLNCEVVATTPAGELVCTTMTAAADINGTDLNVTLIYDMNLLGCDVVATTSAGELVCDTDAVGAGQRMITQDEWDANFLIWWGRSFDGNFIASFDGNKLLIYSDLRTDIDNNVANLYNCDNNADCTISGTINTTNDANFYDANVSHDLNVQDLGIANRLYFPSRNDGNFSLGYGVDASYPKYFGMGNEYSSIFWGYQGDPWLYLNWFDSDEDGIDTGVSIGGDMVSVGSGTELTYFTPNLDGAVDLGAQLGEIVTNPTHQFKFRRLWLTDGINSEHDVNADRVNTNDLNASYIETEDFNATGTSTVDGLTDLNLVEAACDVMASAEGGLYCGTDGSGDTNASDVDLNHTDGSTYSSVQDYVDLTGSAGVLTGGEFTSNGDGSMTVAAGTGLVKITDSETAEILMMDWAEDSTVSLADNTLNFIYISHDGSVGSTTTKADIDHTTEFTIGKVYRDGTELHFLEGGTRLYNFARRVQERLGAVDGTIRASGLQTSESGTLNIAITEGKFYNSINEFSISVIDTSNSDENFTYWFRDGVGGWDSYTQVSAVDDLNYDDDSGTPTALLPNRYGVHWVYLHEDGDLHLVYGQGNYVAAEAQDADAPSDLPDILKEITIFVARIIVQRDMGTFVDVDTPWETTITSNTVTDHGALAGLNDDDHPQYVTGAEFITYFDGNISATELSDLIFDIDFNSMVCLISDTNNASRLSYLTIADPPWLTSIDFTPAFTAIDENRSELETELIGFIDGNAIDTTSPVSFESDVNVNGDLLVDGNLCGISYADGSQTLLARFSAGRTAPEDGADGEDGTLTTTNLKGIWHVEEGTGTTLDDESGGSNDISLVGPTWISAGKYGSALSFTTNDYGVRADDADFEPVAGDFTVGAWIKLTSKDIAQAIMAKGLLGVLGIHGGWIFGVSSDNKVNFQVDDSSEGDDYTFTHTGVTLTTGTWYFVTATWIASTETIEIGINGNYDSGTGPGNIGTITDAQEFNLGASINHLAQWFEGTIDEPFIIKANALNQSQLDLIYNNRWYGRTYFDGKFGTGYYAFTGNSLSYTATGSNNDKEHRTMKAWVYPASGSGTQTIMDMETASNTNREGVYFSNSTDINYVTCDSGASCTTIGYTSPTDLNGSWHHVAAVFDNPNMYLYLDGTQVASSASGKKMLVFPTNQLWGRDATSQANELKGILDDAETFTSSLTANEIYCSYLAGKAGRGAILGE